MGKEAAYSTFRFRIWLNDECNRSDITLNDYGIWAVALFFFSFGFCHLQFWMVVLQGHTQTEP